MPSKPEAEFLGEPDNKSNLIAANKEMLKRLGAVYSYNGNSSNPSYESRIEPVPEKPEAQEIISPKMQALMIVRKLAEENGISYRLLIGGGTLPEKIRCLRWQAVILVNHATKWSLGKTGRFFDLDHSTVAKILSEDRKLETLPSLTP